MRGRRAAFLVGLTAAALMAVPAQAGAVSLFRGDITVGTNPISVAVGNFNGGPLDLAVANEGSNNVSILLGNGFGQFTAATPVSAGTTPSSVVTGSFNGDAFTDMAIANTGTDNVVVRLGDGTGAFTSGGTVATGVDPVALAVGNMNAGGNPDLVSANKGASTISTLLGDGLGGFAADATPQDVAAPGAANPVAIALGNVDQDFDADLDAVITSQTNDQVLVQTNDGAGEFSGTTTVYPPGGIASADPSSVVFASLNPASANPVFAAEPDILIADQGLDGVLAGFGFAPNSTGFQAGGPVATADAPAGVAIGDFDGDGDDDGISANSGAGTATVVLSDGNGGITADSSPAVGSSPRAVAAGGFDADTRADAAVVNYDSNSVTILTSLPAGPPATPPAITTPAPIPPPVTPTNPRCKKKKGKKGVLAAKKCKKKRKK